jgi:acetyltransferase-like isoleucine patch superfamily enzyme
MTKSKDEIIHSELRSRITDPSVSPLKKYQSFVLGEKGLLFLLKYEIITGIFGLIPGVSGLITRKLFYPLLFKRTGKNVIFGRNLTIRHPKKISVGNNVVFDDNCVIDAKGNANNGIVIGDNVFVSRNTIISCKEGDIEIGSDSNIGTNCLIHSETSVKIGSYVLMAAYCYIVAGGSHDFSKTDIPSILQPSVSKGGISIQDDVWLGADVKVLDGSIIGKGTIIGSGAVVNSELPSYSIAFGMPAKVARKRQDPQMIKK